MRKISLARFKRLSRKKKILVIAVLLLLIGGIAYALTRSDEPATEIQPEKKYYSQLTGREVTEEESLRPVLAIMVENSEEARPQAGLDGAGIVFEAVTEGGITRYMALYQEDMPKEVAPVRSVRPYFVDWFSGFDASIAHVGGSAPALEMLDQRESKSLNQFAFPGPYYRSTERAAPHNMHARTNDLRDLQKEEGHEKSEFDEIPRSDDAPAQTPAAPKISVNFSSPVFQVEFRYNAQSNSYTRYLGGQPHIDALTNKPITVKNVVVINMPENGQTSATGNGEAWLFKDGNVQEVRWQLNDHSNRLKLVDANNEEVALNRGDAWISALPADKTVDY